MANMSALFGAFIHWVLGIENVGDDDWDQIYLDRWVPGYINASHPYGKPKNPENPQKARITNKNLVRRVDLRPLPF